MARLDVHPMPGKAPSYVVDVQAELLSRLATHASCRSCPRTRGRLRSAS